MRRYGDMGKNTLAKRKQTPDGSFLKKYRTPPSLQVRTLHEFMLTQQVRWEDMEQVTGISRQSLWKFLSKKAPVPVAIIRHIFESLEGRVSFEGMCIEFSENTGTRLDGVKKRKTLKSDENQEEV